MQRPQSSVVIVGGGTAGWLTAALLAAQAKHVCVTLIESPDIPTIGVGEGTWPSIRRSLQKIGLSERDLLTFADASFKQGTHFAGWLNGSSDDIYHHPFSLPADYASTNLAPAWLALGRGRFDHFVASQSAVIERGLAPRQAQMPEYAFALNYAYHFDAGKFAQLLKEHSVTKLGVTHVSANVSEIVGGGDADIEAVVLERGERISADLFIDCTGHRSLLLGESCQVSFRAVDDILFNNAAVAVQVPHASADARIASATLSTATQSGWVWDIALQSRRGIGQVFSTRFDDSNSVQQQLLNYVQADPSLDARGLTEDSFRTLSFKAGYRKQFWKNNCVAIGLSAGFVEPLEASAIALIEVSAGLLADSFPADRSLMAPLAARFNRKLSYHWEQIIDFLKLHYVLSQRTGAYWDAHRDKSTWTDSLREKLVIWQQQSPYHQDAPLLDELFPSASLQYVLYGMGWRPRFAPEPPAEAERAQLENTLQQLQQQTGKMVAALAPNRDVIQQMIAN